MLDDNKIKHLVETFHHAGYCLHEIRLPLLIYRAYYKNNRHLESNESKSVIFHPSCMISPHLSEHNRSTTFITRSRGSDVP